MLIDPYKGTVVTSSGATPRAKRPSFVQLRQKTQHNSSTSCSTAGRHVNIDNESRQIEDFNFDDVKFKAEAAHFCPALLKRDRTALHLKCRYIADQCGCPLSDVHSLIKVKPCLLIKSPSRVVTHLQAIARVIQVPLEEIVEQVAMNPDMIAALDDGHIAKLSSRTLKELLT